MFSLIFAGKPRRPRNLTIEWTNVRSSVEQCVFKFSIYYGLSTEKVYKFNRPVS
jgi:hypothetical protein